MPINPWRNFDVMMVLVAVALSVYGVAMIYSASLTGIEPDDRIWNTPFFRQAAWAVVGLVLLLLAAGVDYRIYHALARQLYVGALALLAVVVVLGEISYGSSRWLDLVVIQLQPSELGKIAMIIALARLLSEGPEQVKSLRTFAIALVLVALPVVLVFLQPDLGTVAIYVAIWLGMVFVAGIRFLYLLGTGLAVLISLPAIYQFALHDYMRERLETFLDPSKDALGKGYNVLQSAISVGSGGMLGKGWTHGTQTQLNFLRNQHTDFIFSIVGEELGFVGAAVLFALFVLLLMRGLRVATLAQDDFGRLVAVGVVMMILAQVFINIGVNVRLLPVTGVPLPFISYGGSSLLTIFLCLGILQSIIMRREKMRF